MKLKSIPPSMRSRRRYLVFELLSSGPLSKEDLIRAFSRTGLHLLGEFGYSSLKLSVLEFEGRKGIIRFMYKKRQSVKAIIALLTEVNGISVIVRTLGVSGTIKKAREKWW